jgi:hypothetical protein
MPAEYEHCKQTELDSGKSLKDAKRICAIRYYKNHGKTPMQNEKANEEKVQNCMKIQMDKGMDSKKAREHCMKSVYPDGKASFETDEVELFDMVETVGSIILPLKA